MLKRSCNQTEVDDSAQRSTSSSQVQSYHQNPLQVFGTPSQEKKTKIGCACQSCRKLKRKCSGPPAPCLLCSRSRRDCHFDIDRDLRRTDAVEQSLEALEKQREKLRSIFESLKYSNGGASAIIVRAIRAGKSVDDLINIINKCAHRPKTQS